MEMNVDHLVAMVIMMAVIMNVDHLVAMVIMMAVIMNAAGDIIATSIKAEA